MFRSWWQYIKQHWVALLIGAVLLIIAIALIIVGYRFDWTGFNGNNKSGKTLWDWLQLLFVPGILTLGAVWFTARQNHELDIAIDNQQEAALQSYIDKMSELLLKEGLRESDEGSEQRTIAVARTLIVLSKLDPSRKRSVLKFLFESALIVNNPPIVDLSYADLKEANLYNLTLSNSNLKHTNLSYANLEKADLDEAILFNANLEGANLDGADLNKAWVTKDQVAKAKSLTGTTMPDGSIHP